MRLTNSQFVEQLLFSGVKSNELVHYLEISMKLLKKYGRSVLTDTCLFEIKKISPEIFSILSSLKITNKKDISVIKTIIRLLKDKSKDYKNEFVVYSKDKNTRSLLIKYLHNHFDKSEVIEEQVENNSIKVTGEGRFYKRSLDQDLKKIIGIK